MNLFRKILFELCLIGFSSVALAQSTVTTTGGTANTIPMFSGSNTLANSAITQSNGNVGIGLTNPPQVLSVGGYGYFYQYGGDPSLFLGKGDSMTVNHQWGFLNTGQSTENRLAIGNSSGTGGLSGFSEFMSITGSGSVGIGTTTPGYTLSVNGYIETSHSDPNVGGAFVLDNPAKTGSGAASSWKIYNMTGSYSDSLQFWAYDNAGCTSGGLCAPRLTLMDNGNVGIGTTPSYKLDVAGQIRTSDSIVFSDGSKQTSAYNPNTTMSVNAYLVSSVSNDDGGALWLGNPTKTAPGTASKWSIWNMSGSAGNSLQFWDYDTTGCANGGMCTPRFTLMDNGNVGIGTTGPGYKLDVAGQIHTSGSIVYADGSTQSTAWTGSLCGGDYAESIDVSDDRRKYEPGDVLVIDPDVDGKFSKSSEPYSTGVAGVYSTRPGVIGRRQTTPKNADEIPMAVIGIVPVKVSAENGPIHRKDILVTSSIPGYAMKGTDRSRMFQAVVGKAMGTLESGTGVIEVLVSLQ